MRLPKGNPLLEDQSLTANDIQLMVENLRTDQFTGYVHLEIGNTEGYAFLRSGDVIKAIEVPRGEAASVRNWSRILTLSRQESEVKTSTFVVSAAVVNILGSMFAFKHSHQNHRLNRKDMKPLLTTLEQDDYCGVLLVDDPRNPQYLVFDRGNVVTDRFIGKYGEIVCGSDEVTSLLDYIHNEGATIQAFGESHGGIEAERARAEAELDKIKQLIVKEKSGVFRADDVLKLAEDIVRDWGEDVKQTFQVSVETEYGHIHQWKCQAGRKLGGHAEIHPKMARKMGIGEGDMVNVWPVS